jgi:hypothetical protein
VSKVYWPSDRQLLLIEGVTRSAQQNNTLNFNYAVNHLKQIQFKLHIKHLISYPEHIAHHIPARR